MTMKARLADPLAVQPQDNHGAGRTKAFDEKLSDVVVDTMANQLYGVRRKFMFFHI
jgi:hypothetical protein